MEYLLQCGLEPQTIKELQESQAAYKKMGVDMNLEEVAAFEIENFYELENSNQLETAED
jgi:hypothetical protein